MRKPTKWITLHVIQGYYAASYGWEDICQSEAASEARQTLREYRENMPNYPHRVIRRRVLRNEPEGC